MKVYNKDKNLNASMTTTEHGGRINVFNKQGDPRAGMGVNEWDRNGYR